MNSLRRDLMERRLWPVVVLLVLAIAAVPFVLHQTASAVVTPAAPPHAPVTAAVTASERARQVHALEVSLPRDPFATGMPKLSTKPASQTSSSSTSSPASTATTASTASSSSAAMVSPSPAASSSTPSTGSGSSGSSASAASSGGSTTVTTTTTVTTPATTTATGNQWATIANAPAWTIYSVALRFGADDQAAVRSNVARLTPLPSVTQPRVMFMGVLTGGQQAVFALGAGVQHSGPGLCRPSRARCAAIVLAPGQVEQITVFSASGVQQQFRLGLVSIGSRVTHSRKDALAAFDRHSAAGLCELDLADPVTYSPTDGTLASVAATADCKNEKGAVPFPGTLTAP